MAGRVAGLTGRVVGLASHVAAYIATHPAPRSCTRAVSRACRNPQRSIMAHCGRVAGRCPRSYHSLAAPPVTIQRIVSRHTSLARLRASTLPHALARSRPCRGLPWPCRSLAMVVLWAWLAVSWPSPLRPGQPPQPCVTIQSIVS